MSQPDESHTSTEASLLFTYHLNARREQVYTAWTDTALIAQWWGPHGFTTPVCTLDLKPGGDLYLEMRSPEGELFPCRSTFHEIVENEKLVYTDVAEPNAAWGEAGPPPTAVVTVLFEDAEDQTKLSIHSQFDSDADRDKMESIGVEDGWKQSIERLAELLTQTV